METLKKLAVLFGGIALILTVAIILFRATPPQRPDVANIDTVVPQDEAEDSVSSRPIEPVDTLARRPVQPALDAPAERIRPDLQEELEWQTHSQGSAGNTSASTSDEEENSSGPNPAFTKAADRIVPAVVSIHSTRPAGRSFRNQHPSFWGDDEEEGRIPGSGSGIIISANGYIMTNYHVVEDAAQLRITLSTHASYPVQLVGADPTTDIALLKADAEGLPTAYIGDSDGVRIGEWVMAVGNPLNFASTVTTGIVSALGRNINIIDESYSIENFIQTDAVINPGNSGGALVNLNGEVIGINTAIATQSGYYQGYGFAIPINLARKVVEDIKNHGRVRRPLLGISIDPVDYRVAKGLGLPNSYGVLIQGLQEGYPAKEAGLRQGDVVIAVDATSVISVNDLQTRIAQHQPGETVELTIWRDRAELKLDIVLGEAPANNAAVSAVTNDEQPQYANLGLNLLEASASRLQSFGVESGVYIDRVTMGSPAQQSRVSPQTLLFQVNDVPIESVEQFENLLSNTISGEVLKLQVIERLNRVGGDSRLFFVEKP